jgi:hypothetical protein
VNLQVVFIIYKVLNYSVKLSREQRFNPTQAGHWAAFEKNAKKDIPKNI